MKKSFLLLSVCLMSQGVLASEQGFEAHIFGVVDAAVEAGSEAAIALPAYSALRADAGFLGLVLSNEAAFFSLIEKAIRRYMSSFESAEAALASPKPSLLLAKRDAESLKTVLNLLRAQAVEMAIKRALTAREHGAAASVDISTLHEKLQELTPVLANVSLPRPGFSEVSGGVRLEVCYAPLECVRLEDFIAGIAAVKLLALADEFLAAL